MIYPIFPMFLFPKLPTNSDLPPTIYSILESIVNFDNEDKVKIKDLAKYGRTTIFNFDYPLTVNEDKENFECMILNKFMMRRIGYDTVTMFRIALNVKLNEIMPNYNKMFDMLDGWDLFNDGEVTTRTLTDDKTNTNVNVLNSTDTISNAINSTDSNTSDRRYSDTPENQLSDVRDGKYITNYNYDTTSNTNNTTNNTISSSNNRTDTTGTNNTRVNEVITRTPADKIRIYKEFIDARENIYTMIFKDLESLFYGLV